MNINEKLITFGGVAYPKYGNVVIMAGGAASGKSFQLKNILGIDGKVLNVDDIKDLALKMPAFKKRVKDETGHDLDNFDFKNPKDVSILHDLIGNFYKLPDMQKTALARSLIETPRERLPNLIFDVTLSSLKKLESLSNYVQELGYLKENIHIVWVVSTVDIAMKSNLARERTVETHILLDTHEGASSSMNSLLREPVGINYFLDGDIWVTFNAYTKGDTKFNFSNISGGKYIKDAFYIKIKSRKQQSKSLRDLHKDVLSKIKEYVPNSEKWELDNTIK
jgi:hypothetical protein